MSSQRPRRPTAWQVSFPGEDENEDEKVEREPEIEQQEELAVLKGKRKTSSNMDERVRCISFSRLSLFPFSVKYVPGIIIAGETSQSGTPAAVRETG